MIERCEACSHPVERARIAPFETLTRVVCETCDGSADVDLDSDEEGVVAAPRAEGGRMLPDGGHESNFKLFDKKNGGKKARGSTEKPVVSINSRGIYLGAVVHRELLDEAEMVELFVDGANARVGIRPVEPKRSPRHAYSTAGMNVRAAQIWDELGVEVDESREVLVDLESQEFPVIDVNQFIPDDDKGEGEIDGGSDGPEPSLEDDHDPSESGSAGAAESDTKGGLTPLEEIPGVGSKTLENLTANGFGSLEAIHEASISELRRVPGIGQAVASRIHDRATDIRERDQEGDATAEPGETADAAEPILNHERVAIAMDQVGIVEQVTTDDFIDAIDENRGAFGVAKALDGVARTSAADLIRRLNLEDALASDDGLARARVEGDENDVGGGT